MTTYSDETRANKLRKNLDYLLAWNPRWLEPDKAPHRPNLPPHAFYNKHIDDRRVLRRVLPLRSLVQNISNFAQEHVDYSALANARCKELPTEAFREYLNARPAEPIPGPEAIADQYSESVGEVCGGLATKFLSPSLPAWDGIIHWGRRAQPDTTPTGVDDNSYISLFLDEEGKLELLGDYSLLEEGLLKDFERVAAFAPRIGAWIFLSLSAESEALLRDLDRITAQPSFPYRFCKTVYSASSISSSPLPRDASSVPWTFPPFTTEVTDSSYSAAPRRSLRSKATPKASDSPQLSIGVVPSASRRPETTAHLPTPLTAESLVQLGWARAVESDSSMVVFNCGNYERICVRHRETQTLYISDLFDVTSCKDPGYIKLHAGVFLSQTLDAIIRMKDAEKESSNPDRITRKRPNPEDIAPVPNKRRRGNPKIVQPQSALMLASQCDMMLFHLQYDIYHSRAPASFIRANPCLEHGKGRKPGKIPSIKRAYKPHEYFEIILGSQLGDGAVGIVHGAMARVTTKDGEALVEENLVVKLTFEHQPQERMRYEYTVYTRLAEHGVTGVPKVYGLFEDLEGGAVALLMSNCGKNLWELRPDKKTERTSVTSAQRDRFIEILESVHRAGVRHYDIRSANLMLNDAGEAFIVDFDRGRLNSSEEKKQAEMDILRQAMEGLPTDYKIASPPMAGDDEEIWLATPTLTEQTPSAGGSSNTSLAQYPSALASNTLERPLNRLRGYPRPSLSVLLSDDAKDLFRERPSTTTRCNAIPNLPDVTFPAVFWSLLATTPAQYQPADNAPTNGCAVTSWAWATSASFILDTTLLLVPGANFGERIEEARNSEQLQS
ncbi:hypothetical protein C8F01DRAFT_1249086 [Mycena amicta]|nr:hypothetical protein C8F01DRAFT_1249086 [Mycena amicta]